MPRPKKQITEENYIYALVYFQRLFKREKQEEYLVDPDRPSAAITELYEKAKTPEGMREWIDTYINEKGMASMWNAIRQRKYRYRKRNVLLSLDFETHYRLKALAKHYNITIKEMTRKLVEKEEDEIREK